MLSPSTDQERTTALHSRAVPGLSPGGDELAALQYCKTQSSPLNHAPPFSFRRSFGDCDNEHRSGGQGARNPMRRTNRVMRRAAGLVVMVVAPPLAAAEIEDAQLFIYDLNRARANPQQYAREHNLGQILDNVDPAPPLAVNDSLLASASFKAREMADFDYFAHESAVTGDQANRLAREAGYPLAVWLGNDNNIESLAAGLDDPRAALRLLIHDGGEADAGHRWHLLATGPAAWFWREMREIGAGYANNRTATYRDYWAIHTGFRDADHPWITGVVFQDTNRNGRYDLAEGLQNVVVRSSGRGPPFVTTNAAGGFSIPALSGEHSLTVSGSRFAAQATSTVFVRDDNVEVDFLSGNPFGAIGFEAYVARPAEDLDGDWDVDLADFLAFVDCFAWSAQGARIPIHCRRVDVDNDDNVDLADLIAFQAAFTGAR